MFKRIAVFLLSVLFVASFVASHAEKSNKKHYDDLHSVTSELSYESHDYIKAQNEARKNALEQMKDLGNTEKDIEARKQIREQLGTKLLALKEQFMEIKTDLDARKKALKNARSRVTKKTKESKKE